MGLITYWLYISFFIDVNWPHHDKIRTELFSRVPVYYSFLSSQVYTPVQFSFILGLRTNWKKFFFSGNSDPYELKIIRRWKKKSSISSLGIVYSEENQWQMMTSWNWDVNYTIISCFLVHFHQNLYLEGATLMKNDDFFPFFFKGLLKDTRT